MRSRQNTDVVAWIVLLSALCVQARLQRVMLGEDRSVQPLKPGANRTRVSLFIGVMSGADTARSRAVYQVRRAALRQSWFPAREELVKLESEKGVIVRFIVGQSDDLEVNRAVDNESQQYGDIMRLDVKDHKLHLANKTRSFFKAVALQYDTRFTVKVDDDVYVNIARILAASADWQAQKAGYVGCFKVNEVEAYPGAKYFEPLHAFMGPQYWRFAHGGTYAISHEAAQEVIVKNFDNLRLLANEDTSVGLWMLAHTFRPLDDRRLCSRRCTATSAVVVDDNNCNGLCDPVLGMQRLHTNELCKAPPPSYDES